MEKNVMALITLLVFGAMIALATRAWRKRISQQEASFDAPLEALDFFGELRIQAKGFYVATTFASNHLERIAAYGLGVRGFAQIFVFSEGILIIRKGERPLAIGKHSLLSVSINQVAIDKTVEKGGLISIDWTQGSTHLSTHLRIVDPIEREQVINNLKIISTTKQSKDVIK